MKRTNEKLCIVLRVDRSDGRYGHIKGFVALDNPEHKSWDGALRGYESLPYGHELGSLDIHSQTSESDKKIYAESVGVALHGNVDLYEAKRAVKLLTPIMRAMQKMYDTEGVPATFGHFVNRVARAIGAQSIVILQHDGLESTRGRFHRFSAGSAVHKINIVADELVAWSNGNVKLQSVA